TWSGPPGAAGRPGGGLLSVFRVGQGCGESVVDGLAASGGQLRGVLAAGQQRRSPLDGGAFCLGYGWPGLEPEAVADRGGGSDEAGGEVRVAHCRASSLSAPTQRVRPSR